MNLAQVDEELFRLFSRFFFSLRRHAAAGPKKKVAEKRLKNVYFVENFDNDVDLALEKVNVHRNRANTLILYSASNGSYPTSLTRFSIYNNTKP